jgi:uncharacterized membrane protein
MITVETALAAIFTFAIGMLVGVLLATTSIRWALRTKYGRDLYRRILEKAESHAIEHHDDLGQQV